MAEQNEEADCIIVPDSQEVSAYQYSSCMTLRGVAVATNINAYQYKPRHVPDEPGGAGAAEQQVEGEGGAEEIAAAGQEQPQQQPGPPGGDPPGQGGGGDGNQGGAGAGGGDGGEGGDQPEEEEEEEEEEEQEEEEEEVEEQVITTSSSSGPSMPPLVPADPDRILRLGLVPLFSDEERVSEGSMVVHSETSPEPEPQVEHEVTSSESAGGYSDAPTAPLRGSDTESSRGQGHVSTPSTGRLGSPGASSHDVSSAVSTLSSLSSSGESHQPPPQGPSTSGLATKRPITRRGGPRNTKRQKLDVSSSTDTSGRDTTSTSTSTTTTTTTTSDTSHDDGPGGSGAPGDRSHGASSGDRPHNRPGGKKDPPRKQPEDPDQPGPSGLGRKAVGEPVHDTAVKLSEASRGMSAEKNEEVMIVGTLSLSQDDPYSLSCVPPSQGEYEGYLPSLFPGSPTDMSTTANRDESQEIPVVASSSSRPTAREFQQWQSMSMLSSPDYSSLDHEDQKELSQIPSSIAEEQNAASGYQQMDKGTEAGDQVTLLDSSDDDSVQFMGFESDAVGVRSQTSGGFESQNLHLHLTQSQEDSIPLKLGICTPIPPAVDTLPGDSQMSTCPMTAQPDNFYENPAVQNTERSSQVKHGESEAAERSCSVASKRSFQSSPEVGRTDFPSFRLDRPVLDSVIDLENISPEKLKTPQLQRGLEATQPSDKKEVCAAMSSDPGLDAKEHVVKKVLKFTKKGVEEKKRKNLPSKKRMLSTKRQAKKGIKKRVPKHAKRVEGARSVRQGSPDTIRESLVEDSQTLDYHFTSVKKPSGNRADMSAGKQDDAASEAFPVISESPTVVVHILESPTVVVQHALSAVGAEVTVKDAVVPGQVKNLVFTPVTVKERPASRQSFLSSSQPPLDNSVFHATETNPKRTTRDSLVTKPGPKLIRRSSNQSTGVTPGEVLHVTTTIRSVTEKTSTYVLEFRGGRFVKNTIVREEEKLLSREMDTYEEILSPVSTSRSTHSLSSGDMADVSSSEHKSSTTLTPNNSEISSHVSRAEASLVGNQPRSLEAGNQSKMEMADMATGGRSSAGSLRVSDILFSDLESERGSLGKNNRRSSSSLFSSIELPPHIREELATGPKISDVSRKSDGSDISSALGRSNLQPQARVSSDDSLFRQPLPPLFKRRSSGSSGSVSGLPKKDSIPVSGSSSRESEGRVTGNDNLLKSATIPSPLVGGRKEGQVNETRISSNIQEKSEAGIGSTSSSMGSEIPDTCLSTGTSSSRLDSVGVNASENCSAVAVASEADLGSASVATKTTDTVSTSVGKTPGRGSSRKHRVPPTPGLDPGTPILAKWKDHHFYPGEVVSCEEERAKCRILFDDGNQMTVKTDHVIPVSLVPVGQSVLADLGKGWNELVTVISHWAEDGERGYVVRKGPETRPHDIKIRRSQISLNKEQAASVMAQNKNEAPDSHTNPENSGNLQSSEVRTIDKIDAALPSGKLEATRAGRLEGLCISPRLIDNTAKSLKPGLPVFARWSDRHFYPAYLRSVTSAETCVVAFEDGSEYRASLIDIFACDLLPCHLEVMAQREGVDWSEVATVIRHFEEGNTVGYVVDFGDGSESRLTRKDVTLNHLQAGLVLSSLRSQTSETGTLANVSLENLQEGKRRRIPGSASTGSPRGTPSRTPPDSSRSQKSRSQRKKPTEQSGKKGCSVKKEEAMEEGKSSAPDMSCVASSEAKSGTKRSRKHFIAEMNQMNPRATSTPTPKRIRETGDLSPPFKTMLDSPDPGKKNPKKFKTVLFPESKGPLLPTGSLVFHGMTFILTHVEKTAELKEQERRIIQSPPCDPSTTSGSHFAGSLADEGKVPFDKVYLCEQIESGGGEVIDEFDLERVGSGDECFLISDTHQRTRKYFCALAVGIPCVSHLWIRDSCVRCALEDYHEYMLPAGMSLETQQLVKWQNEQRPLSGLKVVVSTENRNFVDVWIEILEAAGCQLIPKIPARSTVEHVVDVVVSDSHISAATWQLAQRRGIPVVSSEWVVQCLVTGSKLGYTGHPKYRHDHE